ncbi:MAG: Ig-like domain-containing protein, partial [Verrucomicrobiales bacterium]|nr:Ig-like domain-containing protein [Verrucomicrobiales bacterium]
MKYFLVITHSDGTVEKVQIDLKGLDFLVQPGDDVQLVDEFGRPVNAQLEPQEQDLKMILEDGRIVNLKKFYLENGEQADPITVTLNPESIESADYEFNAQVGNLPGLSDFTLMRFSNTGYIEFGDQFKKLADLPIPGQREGSSGISGGSGSDPEIDSPPVAEPDYSVVSDGETVLIDLIGNDSDPDGAGITLGTIAGQTVVVGQPIRLPSGAVVVPRGNGLIEYEPGEAFEGLDVGESDQDTFSYTIVDASGDTSTATVTVGIEGVDNPTETNPDEVNVMDGETVCIDVLANDVDVDDSDNPLTINNVEAIPAAGGSVTTNGDKVFFDPGTDFEDLDAGESEIVTFTYSVETPDGATAIETVTVTVNGADAPTESMPDAATVTEGATVCIDVLANDSDSDLNDNPLVVGGVSTPALGNATTDGSKVFFETGTDFEDLGVNETSVVSFTYTAETPDGDTVTETVTITVNGENDVPEAIGEEVDITEHESITVSVLQNDSDPDVNDTLTVTQVSDPGVGTTSFTGSDVSFDPGTDFNSLGAGESATVSFTYEISDDHGATDVATVTVTVNGTNDGPDAIDDSFSTTEDASVVVTTLSNDSDPDQNDVLTITGVSQPL